MIFFAAIFPCAFGEENLPDGYAEIKFGMSVDDVKDALKKDMNFGYRGDRDVSLLPGENRTLIETDTSRTAPYSFLEKCWFQFYDDKLYTITVTMKKSKIDYHSVFSKLTEKYGMPNFISPEKSEWKNDSVIMSLEKPLSIKYTDKKVFDELRDRASVNKSAEEQAREDFLNAL
jgi:hypothetical protein